MDIQVTDQAAEWFETEMQLKKGDYVRFFARYGGFSPNHPSFSLGVNIQDPIHVGAIYDRNGIFYYIEDSDLWYFSEKNLSIDYDDKSDGPLYNYL